jgi:hypothetical protein
MGIMTIWSCSNSDTNRDARPALRSLKFFPPSMLAAHSCRSADARIAAVAFPIPAIRCVCEIYWPPEVSSADKDETARAVGALVAGEAR